MSLREGIAAPLRGNGAESFSETPFLSLRRTREKAPSMRGKTERAGLVAFATLDREAIKSRSTSLLPFESYRQGRAECPYVPSLKGWFALCQHLEFTTGEGALGPSSLPQQMPLSFLASYPKTPLPGCFRVPGFLFGPFTRRDASRDFPPPNLPEAHAHSISPQSDLRSW